MQEQGHRGGWAGTGRAWSPLESKPALSDRRLLIHPLFHRLPPPLIVIGMHRSGTSLVAAMLAALGVFMGPECCLDPGEERGGVSEARLLNGYAEAVDFRNLNDGMLSRAGAAWDGIEPFLQRRERSQFAWSSVCLLQVATFGCLQSRYLRPLPKAFRGPWGWKDPRNSLTLPYWLQLFPEARILHVRRGPEAVVDSLHRRAQIWNQSSGSPLPWGQRARRWGLHPAATLQRARRRLRISPGGGGSDPCLNRDYCWSLSRQYVRECLRFSRCGGGFMEVRYEAILDDPLGVAGELAHFAEFSPPREYLIWASEIVRPRGRSGETASSAARLPGRGASALRRSSGGYGVHKDGQEGTI